MERWERVTEGQREFWEAQIEGQVLKERSGVEGKEPKHREQHCDSTATAEGILRRMATSKSRQGFSLVVEDINKRGARTKKGEIPAYPGLTGATLSTLLNKLEKLVDDSGHKHAFAIGNVVEWSQRHRVLWHLVSHRQIKAEENLGLLAMLSEDPLGGAPQVVLDLLTRLPSSLKTLYRGHPPTWFTEGFDRPLDHLLFYNYHRSPKLFDEREKEFSANVQRALDFVRGRCGLTLPKERAKAILEEIAKHQTTGGLATNWEFPRLEGKEIITPRLANEDSIQEIALLFGSKEEWGAAMVKAALKHKGNYTLQIRDALRACSTQQLATLLSKPFSFGTNGELADELQLIEDRHDTPEALLSAAQSLQGRSDHGREIRELLAVIAARRFGEERKPIPVELDALLKFEFLSGVYHASIRPYVQGLKAIPRERVHTLIKSALKEERPKAQLLGALLAHPDEALLSAFFQREPDSIYLDAELTGRLGAAVLPHLWQLFARAKDRRHLHRVILHTLATVAEQGATSDPKWDVFLCFDEEGGELINYWDPSYTELRARALKGLPSARLHAVLLTHLKKDRHPERAFLSLHLVEDPAVLEEGVAALVERRHLVESRWVIDGLRSLGSRAVTPLEKCASGLVEDEAFFEILREALPAKALTRIRRATKWGQ